MRVAEWLTGLLYQLSLFIARSWEIHLHPRQEALVRTLVSYEVVTPARVNEFGEVLPQSHHFSRRKRSSGAPGPPPARTHYRIRAYGQLFQLNLSADAAFLAAGYTEVHLGAPARGAEGLGGAPPDLRHCFYRGQVNARREHTAVFSLCGGLDLNPWWRSCHVYILSSPRLLSSFLPGIQRSSPFTSRLLDQFPFHLPTFLWWLLRTIYSRGRE